VPTVLIPLLVRPGNLLRHPLPRGLLQQATVRHQPPPDVLRDGFQPLVGTLIDVVVNFVVNFVVVVPTSQQHAPDPGRTLGQAPARHHHPVLHAVSDLSHPDLPKPVNGHDRRRIPLTALRLLAKRSEPRLVLLLLQYLQRLRDKPACRAHQQGLLEFRGLEMACEARGTQLVHHRGVGRERGGGVMCLRRGGLAAPTAGSTGFDPFESKTFRTRVLFARRDPRAFLMVSVLFTDEATRRVKQGGFRDGPSQPISFDRTCHGRPPRLPSWPPPPRPPPASIGSTRLHARGRSVTAGSSASRLLLPSYELTRETEPTSL